MGKRKQDDEGRDNYVEGDVTTNEDENPPETKYITRIYKQGFTLGGLPEEPELISLTVPNDFGQDWTDVEATFVHFTTGREDTTISGTIVHDFNNKELVLETTFTDQVNMRGMRRIELTLKAGSNTYILKTMDPTNPAEPDDYGSHLVIL
jgi:hypothetical protein